MCPVADNRKLVADQKIEICFMIHDSWCLSLWSSFLFPFSPYKFFPNIVLLVFLLHFLPLPPHPFFSTHHPPHIFHLVSQFLFSTGFSFLLFISPIPFFGVLISYTLCATNSYTLYAKIFKQIYCQLLQSNTFMLFKQFFSLGWKSLL